MGNLDYGGGPSDGEPNPQEAEGVPVAGIRQSDEGRITGPEPAPASIKSIDAMNEDELDTAMASEIELLEELNPDIDYSYEETSIPLVEGTKSLRLLSQGNLTEAGPLIIRTAEAASRMPGMDAAASQQQISALRMYLPTVNPDSPNDMGFLAEIVKKIYGLRKQGD